MKGKIVIKFLNNWLDQMIDKVLQALEIGEPSILEGFQPTVVPDQLDSQEGWN